MNEADKNDYDTCPYCGIIGVLEGHRCKPRADKDTSDLVDRLRDASWKGGNIKERGLTYDEASVWDKTCHDAANKIESLTAQVVEEKELANRIAKLNIEHFSELQGRIGKLNSQIESLTAQNEAYDNALRRLGSQEAWTGRDVRDSAWGVGERNAIIKYAIQERQRIKQQGEDDD